MSLLKLDKEIEKAQEQFRQFEKVSKRLKLIEHELDVLQFDIKKQKKVLEKEKKDVEELEKLNMKALFTKILGDKEERLEKERQEYLEAVLKYNGLITEQDVLVFEQGVLNKKLKKFVVDQQELDLLINKKEGLLKIKGGPIAKKLRAMDIDIRQKKFAVIEIKEAIDAGKSSLKKLDLLLSNLKQVKSWNGQMILTGRGRFSSYQKKSFIDKANKNAVNTKISLAKFEKELLDVYKNSSLNMSIAGFERFLSTFYNHLITDWVLQQNINNAYYSIMNTKNTINRYVLTLTADKEAANQQFKSAQKKKKNFVAETKSQ